MELPDQWEAPHWHLPLTIPLIDKEYEFSDILQDEILVVDTTNEQIQIEFPGELDPQGIPDSIFNISLGVEFEGEFSQEPIDLDADGDGKIIDYSLPAQEINLSTPLLSLVDGVEAVGIEFTCFSPSLLNDPSFSENLNQTIASTIETSSLISLEDSDQSFFNLKSVKLSNGYLKLDIDNDLPFQITSLTLLVMSALDTIWEVNADEIDPYTLYNSQKLFSESPITINMTEDINYTFNIAISPEQAGNPVDANWSESCFPDLDSPPVYLCDDILAPINFGDDPGNITVPNVEDSYSIADNTCGGSCNGNCLPLYYCGTDGYLGVTGLSCSEYPYLGDLTSFTSPILDPPIYAYITLAWDGVNISQSGFAYPIDVTCANQNFTNDGVCNLSAFPIPICSGGLVGMPCIDINKDDTVDDLGCNTQTECSRELGTEQYCDATCDEGQYSDGWVYQPINETTGDNGTLSISMEIMADEIGEVVVEITAGIQEVLNESIPSPEPISLPGFNGFNIKGVKVAEATIEYPNQLVMNMQSDFIVPIDFIINMDNFFDNDGNSLSEEVEISGNSITTISVEDYLIAKDFSETESFTEINISYDFSIDPGEYTIVPVDDKLNMGGISYSAEMSDLKLAYITAIADSLEFSSVESEAIENLPDGFEGFLLADIQMELELYSQIGISVGIDLELTGSKSGESDIPPVKIYSEINTPSNSEFCSYEIGDTAHTLIKINKDYQLTYWYCHDDQIPFYIDTLDYNEADISSIVDMINYAPEQMFISGGAIINGKGVLAPETSVWGTFQLIAPLSFIFEQDLTFIPAELTAMDPMDEESAEQLDKTLESVYLNVEILNSSPIGGDLSLLISDSTIFPLFLDSLYEENIYYESYLEELNNSLTLPILYTKYELWPENGNRALKVEFFNEDSTRLFWIGRLFNLDFTAPDSIDINGFIDPLYPQLNNSFVEIDTTRMTWITDQTTRYMVPMISFSQTSDKPRTFQTTNFFGVKSYITFTLDSDGIFDGTDEE